jgi:hypothetical protein
VECYKNIKKDKHKENDIRDLFVKQLLLTSHDLGKMIQNKIVFINWERWVMSTSDEMGRADLSFSISGIDFLIECKRLKYADIEYIREGIKRYIDLKYACGDDYSAMLGFIISGNISDITDNLKAKIKDTGISRTREIIDNKVCNWDYSFRSRHERNDQSEIYLYHLFFELIQYS